MNYNYDIVNFNPKPITIVTLDKPIFTPKLVKGLTNLTYAKRSDECEVSISFSTDHYVLNNPAYKSVRKIMDDTVANYLVNILNINNKFKMTNSWITKNVKGARHNIHNHPNVMLSAICYFNEDLVDEEFAPIVFYSNERNPIFEHYQFEMDIKEYNIYNSISWTIAPRLNQIFIFPAHLEHKTIPNASSKTRYCLGTNYFIDGIVGREETTSKLNIKIVGD